MVCGCIWFLSNSLCIFYKKHTTRWIKIIYNHKPWEILYLSDTTCWWVEKLTSTDFKNWFTFNLQTYVFKIKDLKRLNFKPCIPTFFICYVNSSKKDYVPFKATKQHFPRKYLTSTCFKDSSTVFKLQNIDISHITIWSHEDQG